MLPQEAFPLRHEIVDTPSGPEHLQDKADSPHVSGNEADTASLAPVDSSSSLLSVSHALYDSRLPPDFFSVLVRDMLRFYAEQGDVQMAVSVLIVLGERVRKDIDEQTQVCDGSGRGRGGSPQTGCWFPHLSLFLFHCTPPTHTHPSVPGNTNLSLSLPTRSTGTHPT